ncbi:Uncharacterised protein [Rodentibacter pneumotropicus]|uniref:Uncharacterized protein n=1 Tax=Rodentibacter pneumotropicus TaxID=758 RepID=A0A448MMG1_9PAST|nr:Uncharacterised protein [Rodentibacter pneumotropicus]
MKKPLKNIIFTSASALFSFSTNAANIYSPDGYQVVIAGPITQGDFDKVRYVSRNFNYGQGLFLLNSQGGAAYEGMSIGEYINKKDLQRPFSLIVNAIHLVRSFGLLVPKNMHNYQVL